MLQNSKYQYGSVTRILHWSVALLIIGLIWLGWYMVGLSYYDPWYHDSLVTHRALGMLVLLLAVIKILWTLFSMRPDLPGSLKPWERYAAHSAHITLFVMMLLIPISGYVISTSADATIPFFYWFDIPSLFRVSEQARDLAIAIHYYLAYGTIALILIHAGAALKHQFIEKDGTLKKMLW